MSDTLCFVVQHTPVRCHTLLFGVKHTYVYVHHTSSWCPHLFQCTLFWCLSHFCLGSNHIWYQTRFQLVSNAMSNTIWFGIQHTSVLCSTQSCLVSNNLPFGIQHPFVWFPTNSCLVFTVQPTPVCCSETSHLVFNTLMYSIKQAHSLSSTYSW